MADTRAPRPSTDEETAPLLQNVSHPDGEPAVQEEEPSFLDRVSAVVQEPLSPLTKILLIATLVFLLLSSVFIGLFAGAQHKLNTGAGGGQNTVVITTTATTTAQATTTAVTTTTIAIPAPAPTTPPVEPVCISSSCINLAASVLSSLDETQDPCENLYDFANGGWLKENPIPSDKGRFGHFDEIALRNKRLLQQILSKDSSSHYSSVSSLAADDDYDKVLIKLLREFYQSCMNEDALNEIGEAPLKGMVKTIRELFHGKTTVVDAEQTDSEKERARLTATVAYLHSRGVDALFEHYIDGDAGNDPNFMTLWLSQGNLGLPSKEYYEEESIVDLYRSVLERLLITLADEEQKVDTVKAASGEASKLVVHEERLRVWPPWPWPPWGDDDDGDKPEDPVEHAHKLAKGIIEFEKKIASISLDLDVLFQDPIATYNPVPFENVSDSLPQFNFPTYFSTFAPRNFPSTIIVTSTTYLSDLSDILDETDKDTLEAYFVTRAGLEFSSFLGSDTEAWKATRSLQEVLNGIKKGAVGDRAEYCSGQTESALGFALGRYFVQQSFGGASRQKATKVITDIIETFKKSLRNLDWMDEESADAATQKADAIRVKVGYPLSPNTEDPRSIARWYVRVKISEDTFFENVVSARAADEFRSWQTLGKIRDKETWEMYPSTVNAYFNPPANEIVFPAGILRPVFFHADWPGYMNYGSFGHVASHELTHAFDSAGRLYNQDGKLEEWWTNTTSEEFNKRQKCIVDQYSEYTIDDGKGGKVHVNGNLTSGENIGDSGLIQAYRAWKAQYKDESEFLLPGLNYTREQLFFISFARSWGQNIKPEAAVARVRTDPHSPNQYRVHGTVSNIPEFAAAFNCSAKAKLNPPQEKRCIFW